MNWSTLSSELKERIRKLPENASALASLSCAIRKQDPQPALVKDAPTKQRTGPIVAVSIIGVRKRICDSDNFVGACKHLRDQIAMSLGVDDADLRIEWRYNQIKGAPEGTIVMVQML